MSDMKFERGDRVQIVGGEYWALEGVYIGGVFPGPVNFDINRPVIVRLDHQSPDGQWTVAVAANQLAPTTAPEVSSHDSYRKLIAGVLAQAVQDACLDPVKVEGGEYVARWEAADAIKFIDSDERLGFWCDLLDVNRTQFRSRLMRIARDRDETVKHRINQKMRRAYISNRVLMREGWVLKKPKSEMTEEEKEIEWREKCLAIEAKKVESGKPTHSAK